MTDPPLVQRDHRAPGPGPYIFVSYGSGDRARVLPIVDALQRAGVRVWVDQAAIAGGTVYGPEIVAGVRGSAVLALMCSAAALASRNVRQEVLLAWKHGRPYLPLRLEPVAIPEDLQYWLDGAQWVDVLDRPEYAWLPDVLRALGRFGIVAQGPRIWSPSTAILTTQAPVQEPAPLPIPPTALVGRETQVAALGAALAESRLVTLTGPGGSGKTRLALAVAHQAASGEIEGVRFVSLAPIGDPDLVAATIAEALGAIDPTGRRPVQAIAGHLIDRTTLLVLDNFEQIADAAPVVASILATCPGVRILVTSRGPLHLRGEREFPVPPLELPDPTAAGSGNRVAANPAVSLFVQRARDVSPDFQLTATNTGDVAEICRRLDGLPLAIELAAARIKLLPPRAMLGRLDNRLSLLTGGPRDLPTRQQTLRDTIAWSYDLLSDEERRLFRRLAVFVGGCTLDAAEAVGGDWGWGLGVRDEFVVPSPIPHPPSPPSVLDLLATLVDQSLLRRDEDPEREPRVGMFETIREFGLEQLAASGEEEAARRVHAAWCLALAERSWDATMRGPVQVEWLNRIEADLDNLRSAMTWLARQDYPEPQLRLAGALWPACALHGHRAEAEAWLDQALTRDGSVSDLVRARALQGAAILASNLGDHPRALRHAEEAASCWRTAGDAWGIASITNLLGDLALSRGELDQATALLQDAAVAFRDLDARDWIAFNRYYLGLTAYARGDLDHAATVLDEALRLHRDLADPWATAITLDALGLVATRLGRLARAAAAYAESRSFWLQIGNRGSPDQWLVRVADLATALGLAEPAAHLLGAAEASQDALHGSVLGYEQSLLVGGLAAIRAALGEAATDAALAEGRALTPDQADAVATAILVAADDVSRDRSTAPPIPSRGASR